MTIYLITGGAGSLGTALIEQLLKLKSTTTIRVLDTNEHRLSLLKDKRIRKLYGDIADKERVQKAMHKVDIVIHCAALKNIEITEYNTSELIKTNIIGTDNVIKSSVEANVKKLMFISSDKAVEPTTIYGASKLVGEHVALNYNKTNFNTRISVFRSGNFTESAGNVFEIWKNQWDKDEPLTITDIKCKRYFIKTSVAALTIIKAIELMLGGEIFIPDEHLMPEKPMSELINEFSEMYDPHRLLKNYPKKEIGLRQGEKLTEQLMTVGEMLRYTHNEEIHCSVIT